MGGKGGISAERLQEKVAELNQRLKEKPEDKKLKKPSKCWKKSTCPAWRNTKSKKKC